MFRLHDEPFAPTTGRPRSGAGRRATDWPAADRPEAYQRLVANPFLALSGVSFWLALIRLALDSRQFALLVVAVASAAVLPRLPRFHCLDCGATGRLGDWRRHCCDRVEGRRFSGRPRRFRGPGVAKQTAIWVGLAVLAATFILRAGLIPL